MCRTHSLLIAVLCHLVVCLSGEEFTNKDTDQTWTIPDVSYPDPTFIHNIVPTTDIIRSQGFPVEKHFIQTEDGYILALHRIPGKGLPVLFIHGFIGASDQWIFRNDSVSDLPFVMARFGFDIWLGNLRGNVYSRHHAKLSPESLEFWNFSLHDYASKDLPAMIELVLHKSGHEQLIYVGYSFGGGAPYILADTRPEYTRYIKLNLLLAPFAFAPVDKKSKLINSLKGFINYRFNTLLHSRSLSAAELVARTNSSISRIFVLCGGRSMTNSLCKSILDDFIGADESRFFSNRNMARLFAYTRAGTSIRCVYHIWSIFKSSRLLRFDSLPINSRKSGSSRLSKFAENLGFSKSKPSVKEDASDNRRILSTSRLKKFAEHLPFVQSNSSLMALWNFPFMRLKKSAQANFTPLNESIAGASSLSKRSTSDRKDARLYRQGEDEYNVTKMTIPTIMWTSYNDRLVDRKGVLKLADLTPNMVKLNTIYYKRFNHYDYWVHEDINRYVTFDLMHQLQDYLKGTARSQAPEADNQAEDMISQYFTYASRNQTSLLPSR